jgi:hypothetical protein
MRFALVSICVIHVLQSKYSSLAAHPLKIVDGNRWIVSVGQLHAQVWWVNGMTQGSSKENEENALC